jgi:AcrR family transcriptional regulator
MRIALTPTMARRAPAQKRATTDIDKLHRRQDILVAAEAQLRQVAFENFSMEVLARDLGLARGTLYRYFETRETLLLGLYQQQRTSWCAAMLADVQPGLGDAAFVDSYLAQARADPLFLKLQARLESVIEHNVPPAQLVDAKRSMQQELDRLVAHLARCLNLPEATTRHIVIGFAALLLGVSQLEASPKLDMATLPDDIRASLTSISADDIFRKNALLILDSTRRSVQNDEKQPNR